MDATASARLTVASAQKLVSMRTRFADTLSVLPRTLYFWRLLEPVFDSQFVFFNIAAGFLTNLIGFFIPAYFSLKALESPQPQDDIQWLTYWVVFGMFTFLETFSSIVLYYVPWYYTIKTLAIVWLMLPQTQGAKMVYSKVIRPAFLTTQKTVHQANASTPAAPAETH